MRFDDLAPWVRALVLIELATRPRTIAARALAVAPLRHVGLVSVGMYLLHCLVIDALKPLTHLVHAPADGPWLTAHFLASYAAFVLGTWLAGTIMYGVVERPLLALRRDLRGRGLSAAASRLAAARAAFRAPAPGSYAISRERVPCTPTQGVRMSRPIVKGSFVECEPHPEYGVGRVIAMEELSTRVLFPQGGLRFYRAAEMGRLNGVPTPGEAEVALLDARERELADGTHKLLQAKNPVAEPPKKAKRVAKKKKAEPDEE